MSSMEILITPDLRSSASKAAAHIEHNYGFETLLIDFPRSLHKHIKRLAEGELSQRELMREARERELIPEPIGGWAYTAEPILRTLPRLKLLRPELEIHCYRDSDAVFRASEIAVEVARLTLRALAAGKIEAELWRDLAKRSIESEDAAFRAEARYIREVAAGSHSSCLSGLGGRHLKETLQDHWDRIRLLYVEKAYHRTPLEILRSKLARHDLMDGEVEALARAHAEYVGRYILTSRDRDEAYLRWVEEKVPWLRERISS